MRLIDADALMVKLSFSPDGFRYRELDCDNFPSTLTLKHAKKLVKEEPTVNPWVKTADRLPDDDEPVLVTYVGYTDNLPHNDAIAVYAHEKADNYEGAWYWQDSDGVDDNPVSVSITHWMPIPTLPEVRHDNS